MKDPFKDMFALFRFLAALLEAFDKVKAGIWRRTR